MRAVVDFVNISPVRHDIDAITKCRLDRHFAREAIPQFILALCFVLITENLLDRVFVDKYTVGFCAPFSAYVLGPESDGQPKSCEWAAPLTDIDAENDPPRLARRMASKRTMVNVTWAIQRAIQGRTTILGDRCALRRCSAKSERPGADLEVGYSCMNDIGSGRREFLGSEVASGT